MSRKRTAKQQMTDGAARAGKGTAPGRSKASAGGPARGSRSAPRRGSGKRSGGTTWILLAIGALLVLGSVRALSGGSGPDAGLPRMGSPAPALKAKTLDGDRVSLADLRGKVV